MIDVLHQTSLNGHQVEMVDLIRDSGYSLLTIIDDILDFSKIEAGRLELEQAPISVIDIVENACGMLDHLADKKDVELMLFIDPRIPEMVLGDGLRVRQVLVNLVNNAIKFSSGRTQVGKVSVRVLLAQEQPLAGQAEIEIQVIDNGIGMDEETQARLFTAFTQGDTSTTRRFGGTGLGLIISRHLVKLMGGKLMLSSTLGRGTTFSVCLPFVLPKNTDNIVHPPSEVAGLRCLVIGGQDSLAQDMATYLMYGGAHVEHVADLAQVRSLIPGLAPGRWIWIVDVANTPNMLDALRDHADHLQELDINFVAIERGSRRVPHVKYANLVSVDGNALTRRRFFNAVAAAAGRTNEKVQAQTPSKHDETLPPPSHLEALRNGRLILVAEDNETNQKVILRQLALLGFAADIAENGRQALELWRSGNYALLLSDLHMPEMDGYDLATAIRAEERGLRRMPILALTANTLKGEADRCHAAGMDDYLSKPLQLANLKATLDTWMPTAQTAPVEGALPASASVPVNISVLENLIGNDPEVILEFLNDFRGSAEKIALQIKAAFANGQPIQASEQAHKLKSSARSVGALALGELCAEIETAGSQDGLNAMAKLMPLFEKECENVDVFLASLQLPRGDRRKNR